MAAIGEDAEAALAWVGLLEHHLHTHAAHHVLAALDGERNLHVLLVRLDARLGEEKGSVITVSFSSVQLRASDASVNISQMTEGLH